MTPYFLPQAIYLGPEGDAIRFDVPSGEPVPVRVMGWHIMVSKLMLCPGQWLLWEVWSVPEQSWMLVVDRHR